jgi:aminoglycoside N3'-acetyltransferase
MLDLVGKLLATDKWNSFDQFRKTNRTLALAFRGAGAKSEITPLPTGGPVGDGRWTLQQCWDVVKARAEVVAPVRRKLLDYRDNPFHVVQLSGSTPRGGADYQLVVIDTREEIARLRPRSLVGKMVLTRLMPYPYPYNGGPEHLEVRDLYEKGAAAVLSDASARGRPDAVAWGKFGWGALRVGQACCQPVGLMISADRGRQLRKLLARHGGLTVHADVDIRYYNGEQEVVSGIVTGRDDPQSEVWAIAHTSEPGAVDNASGVATCVEAARILEELIASGKLPRPRRSIRLLGGYECYGFFNYLATQSRWEPPLAGVCIDSIGLKPELATKGMLLSATLQHSASFVNDIAEQTTRGALRAVKPGYRFKAGPFVSTDDTQIGDPKWGFPCPWLSTWTYPGYHSSADLPALLHPPGLATAAIATAAYLYFLADMATPEVLQIAGWQTQKTLAELRAAGRRPAAERVELIRASHAENINRLRRWLWGGSHRDAETQLRELEITVSKAARAMKRKPAKRSGKTIAAVPHRKVPIIYTLENLQPEVADELSATGALRTTLYWADGQRNMSDIAALLRAQVPREFSAEQVASYFAVLEKIGHVRIAAGDQVVEKRRLLRDLKSLGVKQGMDLMVHSSFSSVGQVTGGAETLIDALLQAVGPKGTLMMPSFNHGHAEVYNPLATRTKNGALADAFWRRAEAVRSDHPSHPVAAIGPRAAAWCAGHIEAGVWDQDSPVGRLLHGGGYILSIGVGHSSSTAHHVAEISLGGGCIRQFGARAKVVDENGEVRTVRAMAWRKQPCPVPAGKLDQVLRRRKLERRGKVGQAESMLVLAKDLWRVRREHLRKHCPKCKVRPGKRAR